MSDIQSHSARAEDAHWAEVSKMYDTRYTELVARVEAKSLSSSSQTPVEWMPYLDERWRASARIAQEEIASADVAKVDDAMRQLVQDLELDVSLTFLHLGHDGVLTLALLGG